MNNENTNAKSGYEERVVKDESTKETVVCLTLGREQVFTEEFKKYLRNVAINTLATEIQKSAQKNPSRIMEELSIAEIVIEAQKRIVMNVGREVLDTMEYMMKQIACEEGPAFVAKAVDLAFNTEGEILHG